MKLLIIIQLLLVAEIAFSKEDWRIENKRNETEQIKLWKSNLNKAVHLEGPEKIELLALGLKNMAYRKAMTDHGEDVDAMFSSIQATLLAIPGHAEYYRDRINEERSKLDALKVHGNVMEIADQRGEWESAKSGFSVMSQLPGLETVRVLGEFLADERGKIILSGRPTHDEELLALATRPHCYDALASLNRLPFITKPFKVQGDIIMFEEYEPALASWRQWYEDIKYGKRTFRFEGDPTEYDLNGPAPKEKLVRIARDRKRDSEREAGHKKTAESSAVVDSTTTSVSSRSMPVAVFIACSVLLVSLAWYFLKARSHRSS